MQTLTPVVMRGRAAWDQALLPADEFKLRINSIQQQMKDDQLDTLLVFGSGLGYADLCYVSNYVSSLQWGLAAIPSSGDPILLLGARAGSIEFQRTLTWIRDVRRVSDAGAMTKQVLSDLGSERVGIVGGLDCIPSAIYARVSTAFSKLQTSNQSKKIRKLRRRKSPREIEVIKRAITCARTSRGILLSHEEGVTNYEASTHAELSALKAGASDIRILVNKGDDGDVYPAEEARSHTKNVTAYIGVMYLGYWAEALGTNAAASEVSSLATEAMERLIDSLKIGVSCSELAKIAKVSGYASIPFLSGSLGCGIGLDLAEQPTLRVGSPEILEENDLLSLRLGLVDSKSGPVIESRTVLMGKKGPVLL
ncbi:MAG: M24 family metallopeptidase [Nitrososphaerales archaeon]